jgi:hypothetical protein
MTSEPNDSEPTSGDRGVFGNLPSERPGVRSPRRGAGKQDAPKDTARKSAKASPRAKKPAPPPPPPPREPPPPPIAPQPQPPDPGSARGGVEEVAWAGITVAAEAATLGVRLVSRALEAVRERR